MTIAIERIPMLADNYSWRLMESSSGAIAIIDPAEAEPAAAAVDRAGKRLDLVLLTHHHDDHTAGASTLAETYGAKIVGNAADAHRLPKLSIALRDGETIPFGTSQIRMIDTPGHTVGHVAYLIGDTIAVCGDTLFSLGCGRMFEGTPSQFFASLRKLASLDPATTLLCGHEYTLSNAAFALSVDPTNSTLQARAAEVERLRAAGQPTLPVLLRDELATNPFLRAESPEAFARLRAAKDKF